ncbi:hypothetical protein ACWD4G_19515 [Streptomyces sp. NPDC002643]
MTVTTPSTRTDVVIRTYGPGKVPPMLDVLADIWADAHPELVDNPGAEASGLSVPALRRQIEGHVRHPWSSLLALPSNQRGQGLYARLGYQYAGEYRNTADGPAFDLLLLRVEEGERVLLS